MTKKQVIVIGGGAAGMVAAISARRLGAEVTILERNPRVGKKILVTGNGRCNFTNINTDIACYHGKNVKFAFSALSNFTPCDVINFFEKLGIQPKVEEQGKVFPMSDQASSILDVLLYEMNKLGIKVVCGALAEDIKKENQRFVVKLESGHTYKCDKLIMATGGKAMPSTGSDGNGYGLVTKLGHNLINIFPALVQLMLKGDFFKQINGVKFIGTAQIVNKNKLIAQDRGDILFANYGVSGPPILQISRKARQLLNEGQKPRLIISIIDTMSKEELKKVIEKRLQIAGEKPIDFSLVGLVNKRLIPVILAEAGLKDIKRSVATLSSKESESITNILTHWEFEIRGTKSWQSAQITAGGIDTKEIDQKTMESKLIPGLFFAGEIMDIDGMCGGFNLQWAWSTGYIAGQYAAI